MKNYGIFVDVSDFYYRIQRRFDGAKLDFGAYIETVGDWGKVFQAFAYGMQREQEAVGFIKCLQLQGFEVQYKRPKIIKVSDREIRQCDWGVGIAVDVFNLIDKIDAVVLGVSNPDYIPLVKWIRSQGKEVVIFASCIPRSLKEVANHCEEISCDLLQLEAE